ncbi:aromatic ring-hydroxylating oxygenase subunit alpha [Actibacterium ureilyticum]|uniref:aromatic ring-hydroxylating oxygenase subunit alpha n=1 Tax=Actibacterium ureilyticum TaxID=1590614 RepID=UPI000BAAF5A2|nr:aromatic ring-hydroxylating dioxygenase subunit alpha [Actibacterium ureilyticum]
MPDTSRSDDLGAVRQPVNRARGLPNAHYTDPATFDRERTALLFGAWAGLDVAAAIPEPGDAKPVDFLGVPLLLVRDRAARVRVYQNTCRHRGMILVDTPRRVEGAIRCPYHSWCYGTDGRLVATPHVGGPGRNIHPDIDRDQLGLIEIPSHVWRDVIFVNVDGTAPPFEVAMADAMTRWADFDRPLHHGGAGSQFDLRVRCNWKLAVENYCESYHLPWVHPGLNSYSRLEDHYNIEAPGAFSGQGTRVYRQLTGAEGGTFTDFADLSAQWDTAAEYLAIYPNVLMGVHRDHAFAILLMPQGPEETLEQIHLYYATPDEDPALKHANSAQWKTVFKEDIFVVEGMQRGRHGPHFDGGRFSPAMDGPTHCFHAWAAARIDAHRDGA